ncbi:hypothetical protein GCM10011384_02350 [Psychrobacillus lasiicapitis]|nr:hypothetical protein GCM10011384_02350 [Psychrobacillus lasiicapitis]
MADTYMKHYRAVPHITLLPKRTIPTLFELKNLHNKKAISKSNLEIASPVTIYISDVDDFLRMLGYLVHPLVDG